MLREERRDFDNIYNLMTIERLEDLDPNTPWLQYISNILTEDVVKVSKEDPIIVINPNYVGNLSTILTSTPLRVQANYLMLLAVYDSLPLLNTEAVETINNNEKSITGRTSRIPRWRSCVQRTKKLLGAATGSLYITNYFDENSRTAALSMVDDIKKQLDTVLETNDWMDKITKENAKTKADKMIEHIGYPPELLDINYLTDFYESLNLNEEDFFGNILNLRTFAINYEFSRLRDPVDRTEWLSRSPATVNAWYDAFSNAITFPAGILQGVFFGSCKPKYLNYGAIGWVIGHEITHGFDNRGRQFDGDGNLVDWWDSETNEKFLKKADCLVREGFKEN